MVTNGVTSAGNSTHRIINGRDCQEGRKMLLTKASQVQLTALTRTDNHSTLVTDGAPCVWDEVVRGATNTCHLTN